MISYKFHPRQYVFVSLVILVIIFKLYTVRESFSECEPLKEWHTCIRSPENKCEWINNACRQKCVSFNKTECPKYCASAGRSCIDR